MKKITTLFLCVSFVMSATTTPEEILNKLGENRRRLEPVLLHYAGAADSLKFKAACFLLEHIPIHCSNDRIWVDKAGKALDFNELDYDSFEASLNAFERLKQKTDSIDAQALVYYDLDTLTAAFLIRQIEEAFKMWQHPWNHALSFRDFCHYILPYRIATEPVQEWRAHYFEANKWALSVLQDSGKQYELCNIINDSIGRSFQSTYRTVRRQEPMPLLPPLNLMHRMQGDCGDLVNYTAYCLRSLGVPAAVDFVPYWGTSSGRHFWNVTMDENGKLNYFMGGGENPGYYTIKKELPKVYRYMYAEQSACIGAKAAGRIIENPILQLKNLMDVTGKYVPTVDIQVSIPAPYRDEIIYLCVHNNLKWQPVCGEPASHSAKATFKNMGCGILYMPMIYKNGKYTAIANPYRVGHDGKVTQLSPNYAQKQSITMDEEDGFLIFRKDKKYRFYFWDKKWKIIGTQTYKDGQQLEFKHLPSHTLYLMIPEYTWGKERPFTFENGKRVWW